MVRSQAGTALGLMACVALALSACAAPGAQGLGPQVSPMASPAPDRALTQASVVVAPAAAPASHVPSAAPTRRALGPRGPGLAVAVPPGPSSPISPDIDAYYYALRHVQCAQLREQTSQSSGALPGLFSALADLCLGAMTRGYQVDWAAAEQAYADSSELGDCLSVAARKGLGRALNRHRATGSDRPYFGRIPKGTACVPEPTYVGLAPDGAGGVTLLVLGLRLFEANGVRIDGTWYQATSRNAVEGYDCARVDVPGVVAPATGESVSLRVRGPRYRTPIGQWTVGAVLTDEDLLNLDPSLCAPVPALAADAAGTPAGP